MNIQLRESLNEATNDAVFKKIYKMTDYNDHSGAIVEGLKFLKEKKLQKMAEAVVVLHDLEGHMPSELIKYRSSIMERMFKIAKKKLSPEDFKKFNGSY